MLESIFKNMQPVVKNLLIINALFFLATVVLENQQIYLIGELGLFYPDSVFFRPYQLATHFFMHGGLGHIFFNMFSLVVFGNILEQVWGPKRFLIFYFVTAIGAALLHTTVEGIEIYQASGSFFPIKDNIPFQEMVDPIATFKTMNSPAVGASGAIYGLYMAAAMLFPNTTIYLYFAFPIKMKWLAIALGVGALLMGLRDAMGDEGGSIAHFAHLGGMLFAFILIKIWQKDKRNFY